MVKRNATPTSLGQGTAGPPAIPRPRFEDEVDTTKWEVHYDDEYDTLLVVVRSRPAISLDLDSMMLRIDPTTGEILGFEIEDFVSAFVPAHPELPALPFTPRKKIERKIAGEREDIIHALIDLIRKLCAGGPGSSSGHFQSV